MDTLTMTKHERVMVIDDTSVDRYVAKHVIKKCDFSEEIIEMESAKKALAYLAEFANQKDKLPEIIFLDIRMPEIDGFGFLEQYNNLPETVKRNCIIMMLSTSLDPFDHERASENKFVKGFLSKPLDKEKLENL